VIERVESFLGFELARLKTVEEKEIVRGSQRWGIKRDQM